jgi:hypothetical protein
VAPPAVASPGQSTSLLLEQQKSSGYAIFLVKHDRKPWLIRSSSLQEVQVYLPNNPTVSI